MCVDVVAEKETSYDGEVGGGGVVLMGNATECV